MGEIAVPPQVLPPDVRFCPGPETRTGAAEKNFDFFAESAGVLRMTVRILLFA